MYAATRLTKGNSTSKRAEPSRGKKRRMIISPKKRKEMLREAEAHPRPNAVEDEVF